MLRNITRYKLVAVLDSSPEHLGAPPERTIETPSQLANCKEPVKANSAFGKSNSIQWRAGDNGLN